MDVTVDQRRATRSHVANTNAPAPSAIKAQVLVATPETPNTAAAASLNPRSVAPSVASTESPETAAPKSARICGGSIRPVCRATSRPSWRAMYVGTPRTPSSAAASGSSDASIATSSTSPAKSLPTWSTMGFIALQFGHDGVVMAMTAALERGDDSMSQPAIDVESLRVLILNTCQSGQ